MRWDLLTRSAHACPDPWPLLRNKGKTGSGACLHLVIHGRSGGRIPDCLQRLSAAVADCRGTPVHLEVLTAERRSPAKFLTPSQTQWLVPLLLLPGSHVRNDVPQIRNRMQREGSNVHTLPFLGSWECWWMLMSSWITNLSVQHPSLALVHHPLRPGLSSRFLSSLQHRFDLPVVSFDVWNQFSRDHPQVIPLPFSLAPNRMSEALRQVGGLPSLLENSELRQGLIHCLAELP